MKTSIVLSEDQLRCLASPVRSKVFRCLQRAKSASAKEIGSIAGLSPQTTHFHLKALIAAGLVVISETRPSKRKPEHVFSPRAERFLLPETDSNPELAEIAAKTVIAALRREVRGFQPFAGDSQKVQIILTTLQLSESDRGQFQSLLEAALEFAKERQNHLEVAHSLTIFSYPIDHAEDR